MFSMLAAVLPHLPGLIKVGVVGYESFTKIKKLYDDDTTMTPGERAQLETMIAQVEARIDDVSKDVPQ
jgi:hypothetical protein